MLIGWLGDFELAEEALQDAFLAAAEHWERAGVPEKPGAPFHLARADMLCKLGQLEPARQAYQLALDLTTNQVEQEFIHRQIAALGFVR